MYTKRLFGRTAIVTGAGSGIGRGIALRLAREGSELVCADLDLERAARTAAEIEAAGGAAIAVKTDISVLEDSQAMVDAGVARFGKLDILVNNAGVYNIETEKLDVLPLEKWHLIINTNLTGTFYCCRAAIPVLLKSKHASIVNISSVAGLEMSMRAAYGASKSAIISLTKSIAIQYPGRIRSNCVCPGSVDTPARAASLKTAFHNKSSYNSLIPRVGQPEDIAATVAFLCSDEGAFYDAAVLRCDGGLLGQRPKPEDLAPPDLSTSH